jgi:hypothetical protein
MSLLGTKQSRTMQIRSVKNEITSFLPMTSYKKGSHPELVSGPHRTGLPHEGYLASGVPKQVWHDGGVKGDCHLHRQSPPDFKTRNDMTDLECGERGITKEIT